MMDHSTNRTAISPAEHWLLFKNGGADSLEALYNQYSNGLYNYGSKFSPDKDLIKECIQELFVTLWTRRKHIGNPPDVKNYLFKAFRLSVFKKTAFLQKKQEYLETEDYPFDVTLNIEDAIISAEQNEALKAKLGIAVNQLTNRQKEAIFLKFYEGLSYEEIAAIMDISVKATYKIMARSLRFLRENLSKDDLLILLLLLHLKLYS
ncbi:RNA polymerase sigma factor [Pedobacter hartonius]|uniref:RNA polymerase sigma factor, sigma-70 family n=1 Tax=Pedobacter hartonius TaxID=425514 RepID=A0A1H4G8I0_9SPHI|nr:sigma-70 family RNA polymerase sigma factor [Pedobacter hartonius]SEB05899.1 RNA polymerase sigma factor, sigma-70 family [Pedobacter hartonius]